MAAKNAAASLTTPAAAGAPSLPLPAQAGGAHTLHVEYAVWSSSYRIIHTRPDGSREVWRRGIPTLEDARLRCLYVEDLLGYEARL